MRQRGTEIDGPVRRTIVKSTAENPRTAGKNPMVTLGLACCIRDGRAPPKRSGEPSETRINPRIRA